MAWSEMSAAAGGTGSNEKESKLANIFADAAASAVSQNQSQINDLVGQGAELISRKVQGLQKEQTAVEQNIADDKDAFHASRYLAGYAIIKNHEVTGDELTSTNSVNIGNAVLAYDADQSKGFSAVAKEFNVQEDKLSQYYGEFKDSYQTYQTQISAILKQEENENLSDEEKESLSDAKAELCFQNPEFAYIDGLIDHEAFELATGVKDMKGYVIDQPQPDTDNNRYTVTRSGYEDRDVILGKMAQYMSQADGADPEYAKQLGSAVQNYEEKLLTAEEKGLSAQAYNEAAKSLLQTTASETGVSKDDLMKYHAEARDFNAQYEKRWNDAENAEQAISAIQGYPLPGSLHVYGAAHPDVLSYVEEHYLDTERDNTDIWQFDGGAFARRGWENVGTDFSQNNRAAQADAELNVPDIKTNPEATDPAFDVD